MRITPLIENTASSPEYASEHGLSLYIETERHRILFDMGQTAAFADNAKKLGVDLAAVDLAVLSHGHYDHGGGLTAFLTLNSHAPVYANRHAFGAYYNGTEKYIGLAKTLKSEPRIHLVDGDVQLDQGLSLHDCNGCTPIEPLNAYGLNKKLGNAFVPDDFLHEHYLLIEEGGKRVLISGCSHKGIVNIAAWFRPDVLVGGFHYMKQTDESALLRAADALLSFPTRYYTGHCTGDAQYALLKTRMGDRLQALSSGRVFDL